MKDCKNLNKVLVHTVYDSIAAQNNLSNQWIIDLGNNSAGFRKLNQTVDSVENV